MKKFEYSTVDGKNITLTISDKKHAQNIELTREEIYHLYVLLSSFEKTFSRKN